MISYEIAMGLSVVAVFLLVGDLNLSRVVLFQSAGRVSRTGFCLFKQPVAFVIFFVAIFAETNRTPFDLPEAEQELAGGYNVDTAR